MRSFLPNLILERTALPLPLVRTLTLLAEYKGKEALYFQQTPQVLESLREIATIQSTESSNRIENITAPSSRIRELVEERTSPRDRSEQEIAGYRDVLRTIHTNYQDIPFTPSVILQLHRDLYQFAPSPGGIWKPTDNEITAEYPDGRIEVRFRAVSAFETPSAMDRLHQAFHRHLESKTVDPLLLIPLYVLDFLCIHPFRDGNGRMARLLTLLLLYKSGYHVGRYLSFEKIIEEEKDGYYDSLKASSTGWHDDLHNPIPWLEYFLGVMLLTAYRRFEERVGTVQQGRGAKSKQLEAVFERLPRCFRIAELEQASPGTSHSTITRFLYRMRDEGRIRCMGRGRDANWEKLDLEEVHRENPEGIA